MTIVIVGVDVKILKRKIITFSGIVEVEGSYAARVVQLFIEQTGECAGITISDPSTGVWSIAVCDNINTKYFAVCVALSGTRNNKVLGHVTGIE
jgi:hypothetical protein